MTNHSRANVAPATEVARLDAHPGYWLGAFYAFDRLGVTTVGNDRFRLSVDLLKDLPVRDDWVRQHVAIEVRDGNNKAVVVRVCMTEVTTGRIRVTTFTAPGPAPAPTSICLVLRQLDGTIDHAHRRVLDAPICHNDRTNILLHPRMVELL